MKLLVCGSRNWDDKQFIFDVLNGIHASTPITRLAHGNARGADRIAGAWAKLADVPVAAFPVSDEDWKKHPKVAGLLRNITMLEKFKPDRVVAFKKDFDHFMQKGGTEHMVRIASQEGVPVVIYP